MAGGGVVGLEIHELWIAVPAELDAALTARMETAAGGPGERRRRLSQNICNPAAFDARCRLPGDEACGIGMQGFPEHGAFWTIFANPPAIHDGDAVTGLGHHAEIMGDEDDR